MATSSARGLRAGRATIELSLLSGGIQKQMRAMQRRFQTFGAGLTRVGTLGAAAGAAITGPMVAAAKEFAGAGDSLHKMSARTGASAQSLSELGFAAEQSGSNVDALGSAMFRMRRRIANASTGGGPAVRALRDLGLEAGKLTQLPVDQQLGVIADALNGVENESLAAQYGFEILGDGFKGLEAVSKNGSDS